MRYLRLGRNSDRLYLITYQVGGADIDIYSKASYDPYNWSVPQVSLSTAVNSHDPQPIVLEDGTFFVSYASTPIYYFDVFYRTSRDGSAWSLEHQVTDDPYHYDTQPHPLLQGTPGHVILTWSHQVGDEPYVDHDVYIETDLLVPGNLSQSYKSVEPPIGDATGLLTYTLLLSNSGPGPTTARLADPLPAHTTYDGYLWASGGLYGYDSAANAITWTGVISAYQAVTVTFGAGVAPGASDGELITNTAWLTDAQGNGLLLNATTVVDALPPASAILDPLDGAYISATSYLVQGTALDGVSGVAGVSVSVDGAPWQPVLGTEAWSFAWTGLADGPHNLRSRAADPLGHVEEAGPGLTVTVDLTPPELLGTIPIAGAVDVPLDTAVVLTFSEPLVTGTLYYTVAPDPGGWSAQWNPGQTAVTLAHANFAPNQLYDIAVAARDRAGNSLAPAEWTFTTACAPPEILAVTTAITGCQVSFGAELTGTTPYSYSWSFGTIGTSTEPGPLVDFGRSGSYPYTLTVANCGGMDEAMGTVAVECVPACQEPAGAGFVYTPTSVYVNSPVTFAGSVLSGTAPFSYSWSFGDGSQGMGQSVQHVFTETGLFTVMMAVANSCGADGWSGVVTVMPYRVYLPIVERNG